MLVNAYVTLKYKGNNFHYYNNLFRSSFKSFCNSNIISHYDEIPVNFLNKEALNQSILIVGRAQLL